MLLLPAVTQWVRSFNAALDLIVCSLAVDLCFYFCHFPVYLQFTMYIKAYKL